MAKQSRGLIASTVFLLLIVTPILSQEAGRDTLVVEDRWLAFDKVQHVTFSFLFVVSTQYVAVNKVGFEEREAFPLSFTTAALIGLFKELQDARKPRDHFSKRDLVANGVGLLLGSAVIFTPGYR